MVFTALCEIPGISHRRKGSITREVCSADMVSVEARNITAIQQITGSHGLRNFIRRLSSPDKAKFSSEDRVTQAASMKGNGLEGELAGAFLGIETGVPPLRKDRF